VAVDRVVLILLVFTMDSQQYLELAVAVVVQLNHQELVVQEHREYSY
jgi:hypothetical protein